MARRHRDVVERCEALRGETLKDSWNGEALGALLWALGLADLPSYDRPFATDTLAVELAGAELRPMEEIDRERQTARLWHWRARTADLADQGAPDLPERFASLDQAVAAVAVRGHERGLLPPPLRGDFKANEKIYRQLDAGERAVAHTIAAERHHALAWACGDAESWAEVPLDT
jgi:hypothetical protein